MTRLSLLPGLSIALLSLLAVPTHSAPPKQSPQIKPAVAPKEIESLRLAIADLSETYGANYAHASEYLGRLEKLEQANQFQDATAAKAFRKLRREALLTNPVLDFDRMLLLKRKRGQLGLPTNHQCNATLDQAGYDNELAVLSQVGDGMRLSTLYRPEGGHYVGEMDLHFDADRLLFTMPDGKSWEVYEIGVDGSGMRRVSQPVDGVDNFDGCYLPDGRIVFSSTASYTGVPCWHGKERACSLYSMNDDGSDVRQLCFDQDLDLHPSVLPNGQVIYSRWDYTGIMHIYLRPLMVMNPDGTSQRAVYGSNSHYPNSLFFPRAIPGEKNKLVAILAGYHGPNRMGEMVVLDTAKGWREAKGVLHRIGHRGEPTEVTIRDNLIGSSWPKFLHPYPLNDKYFVTAVQFSKNAPWGIFLVDVFDNFVALAFDPKFDFYEPLPIKKMERPRVLPDRTNRSRDDAVVYMHDVYLGPGLEGVPRGAVKDLRVVAYNFGMPGMAGPDKIGRGGPWDAMRILGTVPVPKDGSVAFKVPANTPICVQPLDEDGKALQLMRSWYTAMPGEKASCVGCHEQPKDTPLVRYETAALKTPVEIEPWHGPARGFDFEREVQPVLDRYCVGCHDGSDDKPDLRAERFAQNYEGAPLSNLGASRLDSSLIPKFAPYKSDHKYVGTIKMRYTPAYEALIPFIRRVNVEDHVGLLVPGEYHADTSELIQMLEKGHHNVALDDEAWDRLFTWIDLNGPCHGTWGDVAEIPRANDKRRRELALKYGGPKDDPEAVYQTARYEVEAIVPEQDQAKPAPVKLAGWPLNGEDAAKQQRAAGPWQKSVDLGSGLGLDLVRIPAGKFVMGDTDGEVDERAQAVVGIPRDLWISTCEVSNEQFRRFKADHFSGYFMKRSLDVNGPGILMDGDEQPAVRISWNEAVEFCRWLSEQTGLRFRLPTEAEWEYACRAGGDSPLAYGPVDADFSKHANLADAAVARFYTVTGGVIVLQDIPADQRYDDGQIATAAVGSYEPNAWGIYDMHGNVAEWTLSTYDAYPYRSGDGRNDVTIGGQKVVRGGSFYDRAKRCRSSFRLSYPVWQKVHNVGFRVICESDGSELAAR
jgi:formylglycine-generating enzyme required for sulfatase activity